jgi:hypothetical protein
MDFASPDHERQYPDIRLSLTRRLHSAHRFQTMPEVGLDSRVSLQSGITYDTWPS